MSNLTLVHRTFVRGTAAALLAGTTLTGAALAQQPQQESLQPSEQNRGIKAALSFVEAANPDEVVPTPESAMIDPAGKDARIDLVLCLDTSGSMSGLIDAARMKLWDIVNDLALAEPTPELRVALLTFGNDGHNAEDGWVRLDEPLTDDLDVISEKLFALTTNGGTEYVGRVLYHAVNQLDWSDDSDALRVIVVAGNESADQDQQTPFAEVCQSAISADIMVNSIYCGNPADDIAPGWRQVAVLADGHFAAIDHNEGTVVITTPFDNELASLSASINDTYIPFGESGVVGAANQSAQDANAASMNTATAAARARTKGSALYNCAWDLVDACRAEQVKIEEVLVEDLPENMQSMSLEERKAYVNDMNDQRAAIQKQIQEIDQQRQSYIQQEMRRLATDASKSFDDALKRAIRQQAEAKGMRFADPETDEGNAESSTEIEASGEG